MGLLLSSLSIGLPAADPTAPHPQALQTVQSAQEEVIVGVPWKGAPGITETVATIMAREARMGASSASFVRETNPENEAPLPATTPNPDSPAVARWPFEETGLPEAPEVFSPQTIGTSFRTISISEASGFIPPDSMGDVGPTQILAVTNGRIRVFSKAGVLGGLNVTLNAFFSTVRNASGASDPHIRYDRLSGRWFVSAINVATPNRVMIAVSSGATITSTASFSFFQFQHDLVGTTPNADTGNFADYDTLGVDRFAVYIGANIFAPGGTTFLGTSGYVVNKANLISGSLTVTPFRGLTTSGPGPIAPQGVNNDDPQATEGYFIGTDSQQSGKLSIRRINNPGGTPTMSSNLPLTVPATSGPALVPHLGMAGADRRLHAVGDRLMAAAIHKNKITGINSLWTAHSIEVNASGVGQSGGGRDGVRWYEIRNLTTTPVLFQSGTLFDSAASNPRFYWMASVGMSGQGHMVLGCSTAGTNFPADAAVAGRLFDDAPGTTQGATLATATTFTYNVQATDGQRWGDYSQVGVDPTDDMTLWTFQEYCDGTDSWGVRAIQLVPFPPATPTSTSPSAVCPGSASTAVTVVGTSSSGSGFFDPGPDTGGPGYPNRLQVSVSGGIPLNSFTFNDGTHVTLNISTVGIPNGSYNVTLTNPDGQSVTGTGILTVANATPPSPTASHIPPCSGGTLQLFATTSVLNGSFSWTGPNGFTSTLQNPTISNVSAANAGMYTVTMTAGGCVADPASTTVSILSNGSSCDDGNVCTTNDVCNNGTCTGPALNCNDNNSCTNDICVGPTTGCTHPNVPNNTVCSDGNPCTSTDRCQNGVCTGGSATNCNDNNVCTDDGCSTQTGCFHNANTAACNDNSVCTTGDACSNGTCTGTQINCDDGRLCTTDSCNAVTGCVHTNNALACDDGNACTTNDHCGGGNCSGSPLVLPQIANLLYQANKEDLVWTAASGAGPGTIYDVARGLVSELPVGSGASEFCLAPGIPDPMANDMDIPSPPGASFWYLVRARSSCGTGSYGTTYPGGSPEITGICP